MKADFEIYDLVIIGAGINGAGVFRDATLNGIKTALIDCRDFCTQTSSKSSKMLHGGIRYLQHLDFKLVYEALHEKNLWIELAPELVRTQSFLLPLYPDSPVSNIELYLGLKLYDALAGFPSPHPHFLRSSEVLKMSPLLKKEGLKGAGLYYDAVVDDKALAIKCIENALSYSHAKAFSYTEILGIEDKQQELLKIHLKNNRTNEVKTILAHDICFCTGPFTDNLLPQLKIPWKKTLALSKGSHLWLPKKKLPIEYAVVMQDKKGRVIFAIPYPDKVLIGTTELPLNKDESLFDLQATEEEISYLLDRVQNFFPTSNVSKDDILGTFCGIRPLVAENPHLEGLGAVSRHHHVYHPHPQISVLLGGKYTTFRTMAQDILKYICQRQRRTYNSTLTLSRF